MSDSINRKNAIEGVRELFACADIGNDERDITYMLENLPPEDRPTGKWIVKHRSHEFMRPSWCICDQCGGAGDIGDNFCKHCGAKMGA